MSATMIDNLYVLHDALKDKANPEEIKWILEACPDSIKILTNDGWLPLLHIVCTEKAFPEVIKMLFEAFPQTLEIKNKNGW
jgi:hypothetical protein